MAESKQKANKNN